MYYSKYKDGRVIVPGQLADRDYFLSHTYGEWWQSLTQRQKFVDMYGMKAMDYADGTGLVPENYAGEAVGGRDWEAKVAPDGPIFKVGAPGVEPTPWPKPTGDDVSVALAQIQGMLRELLRRIPDTPAS